MFKFTNNKIVLAFNVNRTKVAYVYNHLVKNIYKS
jgi:hypothetical protein